VTLIAKLVGLLLVLVLVVAGSALAWASSKMSAALEAVHEVAPIDLAHANASLEIGERIVRYRNGCTHCHGEDLSGNLVVDDPPIGKIFAPNITPAALGAWSDQDIARAIRHGVNREGRSLRFMPSNEYVYLSLDDLASVVAYVRSVPAVEKESGTTEIGPVAKILFATGQAPMFAVAAGLDHRHPFDTKPEEAPTREFGHYLVSSSCIGCHGDELKGGPIPGAPPDWAPAADLTANAVWTKETFLRTMREGVSAAGEPLRPPMSDVPTAKFSDMEIDALWEYLKPSDPS
jgi:mono/diheme cytochrome c family protein